LLAAFGPFHNPVAGLGVLASIALFHLLGVVGFHQRKPRNAELACGPGYVDVTRSGSRNQRILAKDITGATTARTQAGLLLTLQHRKRNQPITLELANDAEADQIRHALGIGHGGFGTIEWRTQADNTGKAAFVGRIMVLVVCAITSACWAGISNEAALAFGILLGQFALVGAVLGLAGLLDKKTQPTIVMASEGLRLKTRLGWFALPYEGVQNVDDHPRGFVFNVPPPYNTVAVEQVGAMMGGLARSDRGTVVAQIMAAALRARGLGPQKQDVSGRVEVLRRHGESPRDWLVRLDMAGQMLASGSGYRGNTLDTEDLWSVLEDPEADADLRAAAARILRHAPNTKVRIDAAVAAVRDETTSKRLRVAIGDDLDSASQELAFLDATDPKRRGMHAVRG
jgi:hypothetical protein